MMTAMLITPIGWVLALASILLGLLVLEYLHAERWLRGLDGEHWQ